jgi:hypothetical protein
VIVTFLMSCGDNDPFGEDAAVELIGTTTVLDIGGDKAAVLITAAELVDGGEAIYLTCRVPDEIAARIQ